MTTTATAAKTAKTLVRCACAEFEIGNTVELPNGEPDFVGETTGCGSDTRRVFAPGHDARLKSLLIKAGIADMEVRYGQGIVVTTDAVNAARQFGFADLVAAGIQRGIAKAKAKAEKAAAPKAERKTAKKDKKAADERAAALTAKMAEVAAKVTPVAEVPQPDVAATVAAKLASEDAAWAEAAPAATTRIKVGRWEFAATIAPNGDATYTSAKGETKVVLDGNYKLV
jgi:hypothetical protein